MGFYTSIFSECPRGTYSNDLSNGPCLTCPDNSEATVTGLSECPCISGYSRLPGDGPSAACICKDIEEVIHNFLLWKYILY